jgi:carbon-monoxide dehydrogenase medium subunit
VRAAVEGANLDPPSDVHASSEYRGHLAQVVALRAVNQASENRS